MHIRMVENAWLEKGGSRLHVVAKNEVNGGVEEYVGTYFGGGDMRKYSGFILDFTRLDGFK
ncbi:hypothetical protein LguiA_018279 [Lonicera macranthoides]